LIAAKQIPLINDSWQGCLQIRLDFLAQYQKNFVSVLKQAQRCLQAWVSKIESAMNACRR
jgi:hypothetical protein